jgi:hypothetical protein
MREEKNSWDAMLTRLEALVRKHGHCNVQTNNDRDPQLGRWVAAQRHRRKVGALSDAQVRQLDRLDFVWSPSDCVWTSMFKLLEKFKKAHGNCDVPTKWSKNIALADWVQRQRLGRRKGRLCADRIRLLEELGFSWSIYKAEKSEPRPASTKGAREEPPPEENIGERLYCIRQGAYVQYGGKGKKPPALETYVKAHHGEWPPYFPLPRGPVKFTLGDGWKRPQAFRWKGQGRLPQEVLDYVSEHGTLPACE